MKRGAGEETGQEDKEAPGGGKRTFLRRALAPARAALLSCALCLLAAAGCASSKPNVDRSLMAEGGGARRNEGVHERYLVHCPDVLDITVAGRADLSGQYAVGPDGRLNLGALGAPRVEGYTPPQIGELLAEALRLRPGQIAVRVADFNSQLVYLFGEVNGLQRAVAYRGQETVLDLLQRVGGITPGAAPDDVYVVRSRIAEGQRPEVFHVDLRAIVMEHDQKTNLRLQPFDQVHVGQTRRARWAKCVPPWLRPLFQALCACLPAPSREHR
jgi:protein involved in polysaccharide export with SLBB domain